MDAEAVLAEAIEHHRNGRLEEAAAGYNKVLGIDPANAHALSVSSILLFQLGDHEESIGRLKKAIEIEPGTAALHNNLANVYRELGRMKEALASYRAALALDPGHSDTLCNVAILSRNTGDPEQALELFLRAKARNPRDAAVNHNLGLTYGMLGRNEEAAECIEACYAHDEPLLIEPSWHARVLVALGRKDRAIEIMRRHAAERPDDPVVQHELAALKGETIERASDEYVRDVFDKFADGFDSQLAALGYRAPELIAGLVSALCGDDKMDVVVDLGCGTGLLAPLIRDHCRKLLGVDLSRRMLLHAHNRGGYDDLLEGELTEFLSEFPEGRIDLAVSADTLVYIGALEDVFAAASQALRKGGAFVATVEREPEPDEGRGYRLRDSGRYCHTESYLRDTAAAAGMTLRICRPETLRREFDQDVQGYLFAMENTG